MKTEVKNTLYRFITMRAPELLDTKEVDERFVKHPGIKTGQTLYHSWFLDKINPVPVGKTKKEVLVQIANDYAQESIKSRTSLRKDYNLEELCDFAIWLTKNRATFTDAAIAEWMNAINAKKIKLDESQVLKLWDNLFYQIITLKSNYVRDEIISLLVADFFISKYNPSSSIDDKRKLAQARVIMPKIIFEGEENTVATGVNNKGKAADIINTKELEKANELLVIENLKSQLESIKKEIVAVEKKYKKESQRNLEAYNKQYDLDVKAAYAAATATVVTETNPVTGEVTKYTEYTNLELPEYGYEPMNELEYCLKYSPSNNIYGNFIEVCYKINYLTTFNEVFEVIAEKLNELTTNQFERTTTSQRVANVNGVVLTTSNGSASYARTSDGFTLTTLNAGVNKYLALTFTNMESGTDIVSGNYSITFNDNNNTVISGEYNNVAQSMEWVLGKLVLKIFNTPSNYFTAPEVCTFTIEGTFLSSTGRELVINSTRCNVIEGNAVNINTSIADFDGNLFFVNNNSNLVANGIGKYDYKDLVTGSTGSTGSTDTDSGASTTTVPDNGGANPNPTPTTGTVTVTQNVINNKPSGYGIKRLGIADYRKVEQEICCYVPGEVSHIENIMAREYKEKSTRRLRRQDDTITTSKEKETEKLTDTTSTERFEMNQEVGSVMSEQNSFAAGSQISWNGLIDGTAHADFANNTSQETSNHQAVTSAQEVTERVLERVVQKVKEERITKIIEEFEENSKHGYDNRKGDKHISGVYRWVDKIYRNQVVNYGKRLMYEFMIPEPAVFHNKAIELKVKENEVEELIKPIDPRTFKGSLALKSYLDVREETYSHWAGIYNAEVEKMPDEFITLGESFSILQTGGADLGKTESNSAHGKIKILNGYETIEAYGIFNANGENTSSGQNFLSLTIGNFTANYRRPFGQYSLLFSSDVNIVQINNNNNNNQSQVIYSNNERLKNYRNEIPVSFTLGNHLAGDITASIKCQLTPEAKKQWQIATFNAIISAYEDRLQEYNDKLAELKQTQVQKVKTNPLFYRQIENTVLRKNCIEYMISNDVLGKESLLTGNSIQTIRAQYDNINLETYATKVKFFEQAFEWNLMSYYFYPFYWANKENWQSLYNVDEVDDAVFRAFLQSGMARVIVTVRPGFEEMVNWYMATGQVWNGGQVPTMDDPLFVSIVKELQEPEGTVEQTWESRVPTSLTVIQAGTIGLNVQGLPCDDECKDNLLFDSDGSPVLDGNGNQINIIGQNPDTVQLGNITDELVEVSESIEEIKTDIEEIKTTLNGMSGGGI